MKVLQLYNRYRSLFGGEEAVVLKIHSLVEKSGGQAKLLMKSSRHLDESIRGKAKAFCSGLYNPKAYYEIATEIADNPPDVVHVHNLYPLFSPSVLVSLHRAGLPVVMTVHNHFHTCPKADHFHKGRICERCTGGREYNCVLQNCRKSLPESFGYALRSFIARKFELFTKNVTAVIALNEFGKSRLMSAGFNPGQIVVLPNTVDIPESPTDCSTGEYAIFSGRMCIEKGVDILLEAARLVPNIPVRILGGGPTFEDHRSSAPQNVTMLGQVDSNRVAEEYRSARFLVVPSTWFEGCPLVILEAMSHGLPVIASRIGGLPELVEDGVNGLLFSPGDGHDLALKMLELWEDPDLCKGMGEAGRARVILNHSEGDYWIRLRNIYEAAISDPRGN